MDGHIADHYTSSDALAAAEDKASTLTERFQPRTQSDKSVLGRLMRRCAVLDSEIA